MNLLERVKAAGVVGLGGAGFPTHVKLAAQGVDTLIINGAECEPLLRTDRWLMCSKAPEIIEAVVAVKEQLGAQRAVVALKQGYADEIAALEAAIDQAKAPVELFFLQSFYPAGDEQVQVCEVTGRVVPPGGIPLDVGCVVSNAATMYAVRHAMHGRPFTQKYLTVTGAVKQPAVMRVPIGTSFAQCLALAGGAAQEGCMVVSGGPMMGQPMTMEQAMASHVTKTTSGYLVLPESARLWQKHITSPQITCNRAKTACVQCTFCTQLCPRWLLGHPIEPHKIMRQMAGAQDWQAQLENPVLRNAQYCCECGVCELIACPMELRPRAVNVMIKQALAQQGKRTIKGEGTYSCRDYRQERAVPTAKAAARAGAGRWYSTEPAAFLQAKPQQVSIALDSHIGAPAEPVVQAGEQVVLGQCIAEPPEGKLGARCHASIAGKVLSAQANCVVIEAQPQKGA